MTTEERNEFIPSWEHVEIDVGEGLPPGLLSPEEGKARLSAYATGCAVGAENERLKFGFVAEVLDECRDYFEQRAEAEYFPDSAGPVGNEEMYLLTQVDRAMNRLRPALAAGSRRAKTPKAVEDFPEREQPMPQERDPL